VRCKSCQDKAKSGHVQVRSDKVTSTRIKIRSRSDQVSSSSCQCQLKDMPVSDQVMVGQYNVRSMSVQDQDKSK